MSHCPLWDIKDQMNIIKNTFPVVFKHWHLLFSVRYFMFTVFWSMRGGVHRGIKWPCLYMLTLNWIHHFWRVGSWPITKFKYTFNTLFFFLSVESLFTTIHPMNLFMCLLKNTCSHKINEFLVTVPSTLSSFGLIKEWLFTVIVTVQITLCVISYQPLHYLEKTSVSCSSQMSIVSQDSSFLFPFSLSVE